MVFRKEGDEFRESEKGNHSNLILPYDFINTQFDM